MITMTGWRVRVPDEDARLGYETETGVARLVIQLDGNYDGWQFKLDTRREYQELNVFDFVHEGNTIYFDITEEIGLAAGRYACQIRGVSEGKRQMSNVFCLYVGESLGAVTVLERVPVAELYQLEQRLTALKAECEELAQTSTGAASDAVESMRATLEEAEQAVESARQAAASQAAADTAAVNASRDAETSTAAKQAAETAKAATEAARDSAEAALQSAQAALEDTQAAKTAAQTAAESAQTDRAEAEAALEDTQAAKTAAQTAAESAESDRAAAKSARDEAVKAAENAQYAMSNVAWAYFEGRADGHLYVVRSDNDASPEFKIQGGRLVAVFE